MKQYKKHIVIILFFKLILIFSIPLTGDEAYFIKWGDTLSLGYYDHPPMVGWLIYLMQYISESYTFFRLFAFFTTLIVAYLIYKILKLFDVEKKSAQFATIIYLIMPIDILTSLYTNDIPLLLFGTLGTYYLVKSLRNDTHWLQPALLSGIFFGLSFLSKYFVAILMIGLLIFALLQKKSIKKILIVILALAPFIALNLYFNYNSCWNNIMFNFFARTGNLHYNISSFSGYFALILYLLSPWGLYYLFKAKYPNKKFNKFILPILGFTFFVFALVSLKKVIGLHWFLLFSPYMFMLFAFVKEDARIKILKYTLIFTYVHIAILISILLLPDSLLSKHKKYSDIVLFTHIDKVCQKLQNYDKLFATGYTSASILSYGCKKEVYMILNNSKYGRLDDKLFDLRDLDGTIYIFDKKKIKESQLKKIFSQVTLSNFEVLGATFYLAECSGFNYDAYKKYYLDIQKEKFYNIPKWLPIGECYFNDRYYK